MIFVYIPPIIIMGTVFLFYLVTRDFIKAYKKVIYYKPGMNTRERVVTIEYYLKAKNFYNREMVFGSTKFIPTKVSACGPFSVEVSWAGDGSTEEILHTLDVITINKILANNYKDFKIREKE